MDVNVDVDVVVDVVLMMECARYLGRTVALIPSLHRGTVSLCSPRSRRTVMSRSVVCIRLAIG